MGRKIVLAFVLTPTDSLLPGSPVPMITGIKDEASAESDDGIYDFGMKVQAGDSI